MPEKLNRIAIVGLGRTGQALGLALRHTLPKVQIIGHDKEANATRSAEKCGAVSKTHWNLISACDQAQLIFLALPADQIRPTLQALAKELKQAAIITDTAPLKGNLIQWAETVLPANLAYIAGLPLLPEGELTATSLTNAVYCLTPTQKTNPDALSGLASIIEQAGAKVVFLTPEEHDSLILLLQQLPALAAAIAISVVQNADAREDRKLLRQALPGSVLNLAQKAAATGSADLRASRQPLLHWLQQYKTALNELSDALAAEDDAPLTALLAKYQEAITRQQSPTQNSSDVETDRDSNYWRRMIGMR